MSNSIETGRGNSSDVGRRKNEPMLHRLEPLEPRKLLTTLVGGDTFQFIDVHGQLVRVTVNGDAIVELIGAQTDGLNLNLGDLTGMFVGSTVGKGGTTVGPDGVELLSSISIVDNVNPDASIPWQAAGVDEINLQNLAARPDTGALYGINVVEIDVNGTLEQIVQLVEINTATGQGVVNFHLGNLPDDIEGIRAAAFDPNNPDNLYFVAEANGIDRLYFVDVTDGTVTTVGAFGELNEDVRDIKAIAFDDLGGASRLIVLTLEEGANRIVVVDPATPGTFVSEVEIDFAGGTLTSLEGIVLLQDDDGAPNGTLVAVEAAGAGSDLFLIDIGTGEATIISSLPDQTDTTAPIRGQDLQGLTWHPTIDNPFTGGIGAFVAVDATSDELVFVDPFELELNQLFAIYVSQASENASISVSTYHVNPGSAFETPYTGVSELNDDGTNTIVQTSDTRFDLQVLNPDGELIIVPLPDGVGGVHIGALQWTFRPGATEPEPLLPLTDGELLTQLGVYAPGVDLLPDDFFNNVSAGVFVAPGLLDYFIGGTTVAERMMGLNLDNIAGLAVKRDQSAADAIVVIDIDGVGDDGLELNGGAGGDQLALLDPQTGRAVQLVDVIDSADGTALSNVLGMAFGDVGFTGQETLYAIYNIDGDLTLGTIDTDPTSGTFGEFTAIGLLGGALQAEGVRTMAFAPVEGSVGGQQALYVIGGDGLLYEVDPTDGSLLTAGDELLDSEGNTVDVKSIVFNRLGTRLLGHDVEAARLVDIDLSTLGSGELRVGDQVATEAGTLRPTVGALAYDYTYDRFLAADNAASINDLGAAEADALESAVLMKLRGVENDVDGSQDIDYILVGGKVTGKVDLSGSIDTFYAGLILTGETFGQPASAAMRPDNFLVGGDMRNLVAGSWIGGLGPDYITGFDLVVEGQLGQMWVLDSMIGTIDVVNDVHVQGSDTIFRELEGRQVGDNVDLAVAANWLAGLFYDGTERFYNDTWATAQTLGTLRGENGEAGYTTFAGNLLGTAGDALDFYSIALMAGQTIEVVLDELLSSGVAVGVFDPDGRLIATNAHTTGMPVTYDPFRFTADRPGEYRIAVAFPGNHTFESVVEDINLGYTIHLNEVGELGLGGIRLNGDYVTVAGGQRGIHVQRGDLGAIRAGGSLIGASGNTPHETPSDIHVRDGNLRSIHLGGSLAEDAPPVIEVRNGGIGLIRADGEQLFLVTGMDGVALVDGDIQVVHSPGNVGGLIYTNAGLGVIRAGQMIFGADIISVNTDNVGEDGIIDLIDVTGDLGVIDNGGGPVIRTGLGGNVRYMRVGGTIWQDQAFHGGGYEPLTLAEGESYLHVDDGGGRIRITPGQIENPDFDPTLPEGPDNPQYLHGALTIHRYAIRGSGGSVLVSVTSSNYGVDFESLSNLGSTAPVEVGLVQVEGAGQAVVLDANGKPVLDQTTGTPLSAVFRGALPIDVLEIIGGNFTEIANMSGGEIVSVIASSVGVIRTRGALGLPKNHTGAKVVPIDVVADVFPFSLQSTAIFVQGHVERIQSNDALGNIIVLGSAGEIIANNDRTNTTGGVEGILAPIFVSGDLFHVNIGESLAPSGSGVMSRAGIYVEGRIGQVVNQGLGSDIRGDIVSETAIDSIKLNNGAIIHALVAVLTDVETANTAGLGSRFFPNGEGLEIGSITLTGKGGIIGSLIQSQDMGNITVKNGFGIVNSRIYTPGQASIGNITVDGYGVLGLDIQAASSMGNLTITGDGRVLSITDYSESIRYRDFDLLYDPRFDVYLSRFSDLGVAFVTNPYMNPGGVTNNRFGNTAGQLHSTVVQGLVDIKTVKAHRIVNSRISFANSVGAIITGKSVDNDPTTINGLTVTTGLLKQFKPGADVSGLDLTVAGLIKAIQLKGNLIGDSQIRAVGINGAIGNVVVTGELQGSLYATNGIKKINVGGNWIGDITANGASITKGNTVNNIVVGGNFLGSMNIGGDVGSINVAGSLGQVGDTLYIDGSLKKLVVGNQKKSNIADVIAIGRTAITDLIVPEGTFDWSNAGVSEINLQALASRGDRRTFSFNVVTVDIEGVATQLVQLVELNTFTGAATVRFHLQDEAALPDGIDAIRAAAFDPSNANHLYFVADVNGIDQLFHVDVTTGVVTAVAGTFNEATDVRTIHSIVFDVDAGHADGRRLYALSREGNSTQILEVDLTDTDNFVSIQEMRVNGKSVSNVTGLAMLDDDPASMDAFFLAIEANGKNSRVLKYDHATGEAHELGLTTVSDSLRGQDLQGLTYNPLLVDPFTGELGAFIAVDATTDELVYINGRSTRVADIVVNGDVNSITVFGQMDGSLTVTGDLKQLVVTAESSNVGGTLINDDVLVGGDLNTLTVRDGDIGAGATVSSITGSINKVNITNGSLFGNLIASEGSLNNVTVTGSDLHGTIRARQAKQIRFDGTVFNTAVIDIAEELTKLQVGAVIDGAAIMAGSLQNLDVSGYMGGDLDLGYRQKGTQIRIGGDWLVSDNASINSDVTIQVSGDLMKQTPASVLHVGGSVNQLRVDGDASIDMVVDGGANQIIFNTLGSSVLTFGHHVNQFTVNGDMANTLVQVGISAGDDNTFASATGEEDANETSRIAHLQRLSVGSMTDSIVAAGGSIDRFDSGSMINSSVSAGLSVGSHAIRAVQDDITRLANVAEQNAARSGDDRVLFWGDISQATVNGGGMVSSYITAGVDAGAAGDFATPDVLRSVTGGASVIGRINATVGAGSRVVVDAGIRQNNATAIAGGTIIENVTYDIDDLTTNQGSPLQANAGSATQGSPLLLAGGALRIVVNGPGTVTVFDDDPTDGVLDAIVLTDTASNTRVTIEGDGNYDIGRILTADDATVGDLVFDGDLIGDGTDAPDLWIDGSMRRLQFRDLGGDLTGRIGGDITQLTLADQGSGRVTIGGTVRSLSIGSANDTPLQNMLGAYSGSYNTISVDAAGNLWAHAGNGVLQRIDPTLNGPGGILETVNVLDAYSGKAVSLVGIDFLGGDLFGIARLYDPQPTQLVGTINEGAGVDLRGLAVNLAGEVYAIDSSSGFDQLVRIDTATGAQTVIGTLRSTVGNFSFTQDVLALSFRKAGNDSEQLIALVSDQNGNGAGNAGVALVQIELNATEGFVMVHRVGNSALIGTLLDDGGAINDDFTGLTTDSAGNIFAIRRNGPNDELVRIALDGTVTSVGDVEVGGGGAGVTTIGGIGFDQEGNLVAFDNDGATGRLIFLSAEDLALNDASAFQELTEGSAPISADIDVFAMGRSGEFFRSYAYDTAGDGAFYAGAADGPVSMLGVIDLATGAFQRLLTVADAAGAPASIAADANLPLAADQVNNLLYMVATTDDGGWELVSFDPAANAFTVVGRLVDSAGRDVEVSAIEFDETTGELIGLELDSRRLVTIDPATAAVTVRTEPAVISAKLTDLTYDSNAGAFLAFQNTDVNRFVQLKGTTEAQAGRIQAVSVDKLDIGSPYFGRLVTTGNTFNRVTIDGDFNGALVTAGGIKQLTQRSGDFNGLLEAVMDIGKVQLKGDVLSQARIVAGSFITNLNQNGDRFAGSLDAVEARNISLGEVLEGAVINVSGALSQLKVSDGFAGEATIGTVAGNVRIGGLLGSTGRIEVIGDARNLQLQGGTAAGSVVNVGANLNALNVQGVHEGTVIVGRDLNNAGFREVDGGTLIVGRDGGKLNVNTSTDGLFAYGVLVGEDGIYNTSDDLIRGGSLKNAKFNTYIDSVLTAGVLPPESAGEGAPADNRVYLRRVSGNGTVTNAVEAGGVRPSTIGNVNIGNVITTTASRQSLVVAADAINRINVRNGAAAIQAQTHSDPFGAPTVVEVVQLASNRIRIVLSEPVNTDSLRLSQVLGDNGTIVVTEGGQIVSGVTLAYSEQTTADGTTQGVITLTRNVDFGEDVTIRLVGTGESPIIDRSGLRSELRLVGDPLGTILDGNNNGQEGGDYLITVLATDTGNDFTDDYVTLPLAVGETITVNAMFESASDVDIVAFNAAAGEYFAVRYEGAAPANMAVFFRDDQGTADTTDDTFEVLARYETSLDDAWMFQAFELPETGEYFVAVTPYAALDGSYKLHLSLAADDVDLARGVGGMLTADNRIHFGGDNFQEIAYFSAGKRVKKELVYLNFDGGLSFQTVMGNVLFGALDAALLDPMLEGQTNRLIYGGDGVVGILDKVMTIFTSYPGASVFVDLIDIGNESDLADYVNAPSGLFFTTVDPVVSGLYAAQDFTTIFVGEALSAVGDFLGLASNIDVAGMTIGDEGIVPVQAFAGLSQVSTVTEMLNRYSNMLANTIAHELLHTMGFNHQPTAGDFLLLPDDPNNDGDLSDSNGGQPGIMAYFPIDVDATMLGQLGTLPLTPNEFPVGHIDTAWLFNLWFS